MKKYEKALITGASSGIGLAIAKELIMMNISVIGIARDFSKTEFSDGRFEKIECDISDLSNFEKILVPIEKKHEVDVLINNAGLAYFAPHEELSLKKIDEIVKVNLTSPMLACKVFLRSLKEKKGLIINISSVTAKSPSPFAAAYGAAKAGISAFSKSIFEENRKHGLKVTTVHPDIVKSGFYRNAFFAESDDPEAFIECETVAKAVSDIIKVDNYAVISEITILPQKKKIGRKKPQKCENIHK